MTLSNLEIWIAIIAGILTIIGYFTGFFKWVRSKLRNSSPQNKINASIVILPQNTQFAQLTTWWHMGSNAGKPAMQIIGDFLVTNITEKNVQLTGAELKKSKVRGEVSVKELTSHYSSSSYKIPPNCTTDIRISFWIEPPIKKVGQTFSDDVAIIDQYGQKHWIKNIKFKYS